MQITVELELDVTVEPVCVGQLMQRGEVVLP